MKILKHNQITKLVEELKRHSADNKVAIWKRIATDLEKPTRQRRIINVFKINQYANANETIIVPGKVLGSGELTKKVVVAAYNFSDSAYEKIKSKGEAISINELMRKNPKGQKVRILG